MQYVRFNLASVRASRGKLTQREISQATGLSQKTLSALETGTSKGVDFNTLAKLCAFLKCTPNDLLVLEEEVEDIKPSPESMMAAKEIVAKGLERALAAPRKTPEELWREFDELREKIRAEISNSQNSVKEIKKRA